MARIALLDASPGVVTSVEAVAAGHEIVVCERRAAPQDVALVIIDFNGSGPLGREVAAAGGIAVPTLVLVDRRVVVAESLCEARGVSLLRKPFDLLELRRELCRLLGAGSVEAPPAPQPAPQPSRPAAAASLDWLCPPLVPAAVASTLEAALDLSSSLWLVGETGTGRRRVAGAIARCRRPSPRVVAWHPGEDLTALLPHGWSTAAADDDALVGLALFVPDIDVRPLSEQHLLEEFVTMHPGTVVIATSGDDPGEAVLSGTLSRGLYHLLARLAVRLPPLRERRSDIAPVAKAIADALAASYLDGAGVSFTHAACRKLELYAWPANLTELEGVVTRSLIAVAGARRNTSNKARSASEYLIDAGDLVFAPALAALGLPEAGLAVSSTGARRSAVVVSLGVPEAAPAPLRSPAAAVPARADTTATAIEPVLAALAHDLRNPMTTLKTFAALAARAASDDPDSAELAGEAVKACDRIDTHLELLHEYAALGTAQATRIDLVALFVEAIEEARLPVAAAANTRHTMWALVDASHARFIAAAVLDESRERLVEDDSAWIDVSDSQPVLEICIPRGGRAVEHLGRWLEGEAWPWRLALAREVARRGGGDLELRVEHDELCVQWHAPLAEEASDGEAGRIDRRRRSGSS